LKFNKNYYESSLAVVIKRALDERSNVSGTSSITVHIKITTSVRLFYHVIFSGSS